jgi:hypothetical protein
MSKQKPPHPENTKDEKKGETPMNDLVTKPKTDHPVHAKNETSPGKPEREITQDAEENICPDPTPDTEPESGAMCEFQ